MRGILPFLLLIFLFSFFRLTDFLSDAAERIAILKVVHRRVKNRQVQNTSTQTAFACSKLTVETPEQCEKSFRN